MDEQGRTRRLRGRAAPSLGDVAPTPPGSGGFVLDASVALAWCFEDEAAAAMDVLLERLAADEASAPAIWPLEVADALLVAERRQRLTVEQTGVMLDLLSRLPIRLAAPLPAPEWAALVALARGRDLTAHDAAYLDLALRSGLPLASTDLRLRAAATALGVPVLP